jgi:hypothetical protein
MPEVIEQWTAPVIKLAKEVVEISSDPWPVARMLRSGGTVATGYLLLSLLGHGEDGVICAVFANLLVFLDQAGPIRERLSVMALSALLSAAAGALGAVIAGSLPLVLIITFALALVAGFVHGSLPGVEMMPRNALICLVAGAYLPGLTLDVGIGVGMGTLCALVGALIDDAIRKGERGPALAKLRQFLSFPGPRFSAVYGTAAVCGLALGNLLGGMNPHWVTITTLVVMQPDRRANARRALQRFLGTTAGVIGAFIIALLVPEAIRRPVLFVLTLVMPFIWPLAFVRNYGYGVAIFSTWILLLLDLVLPPNLSVAALFGARLADTTLGCTLALAGSLLVYETAKPTRGSVP